MTKRWLGFRGAAATGLVVLVVLGAGCDEEATEDLKPQPTATNGTRLRAVFAKSGPAQTFLHFLDRETGLRCRPGPDLMTGGPDRCFPLAPLAAVIDTRNCGAESGPLVLFAQYDDQPFAVGVGSEGLFLARLTERYEGPLDESCRVLGPQPFLFEAVSVELLASGQTEDVQLSGGRVVARVFEGSDGSRAVVDLFGTELEASCAPVADNGGLCRPQADLVIGPGQFPNALETWVDAATCSRRAVVVNAPAGFGPLFGYRRLGEELGRLLDGELGRLSPLPATEALARVDSDGACVPSVRPELAPRTEWAYFDSLSLAEQASLTVETVGDRLTRTRPVPAPGLEGVAEDWGIGLLDTVSGFVCDPVWVDGSTRCGVLLSVFSYSDPDCSQRVVDASRFTDELIGTTLASTDSPWEIRYEQGLPLAQPFLLADTLESGPIYQRRSDGRCEPLDGNWDFRRLVPQSPEMLPAIKIVVE